MIDYIKMLNAIPPDCNYGDWLNVGMALKHEGLDWTVWDEWSRGGSKYVQNECEKKWRSFKSSGITGGTLFHIASQYGYEPEPVSNAYDIHNLTLDECAIDPSFVSIEKVPPVPDKYNPKGDMLEYFTKLFQEDDFVGYCLSFSSVVNSQGKTEFRPAQTQYRRTAGDIIKKLRSGSIENALGTLNSEAGAYVRFNPLDGKGENNVNVTRWKYCLIESDNIAPEKQYSLLKAMNLPITFLVNSGGKSLHAITRVDAENAQQYRQRVKTLYEFCKKSGFEPDEQDKNESRFSRLPGVQRRGKWQYIIERDMGAASYEAWLEWCQQQADDLPPDVALSDVWNNMPPLKDELIPGVLRVGHKMLLAGPSKAGKSFLLINLAISIAEGVDWLGMKCRQGRVCYVNLELDAASCFHRFREIYEKRGLAPNRLADIDIWNLRGKAATMDRLAPVMIHRFKDKKYAAIIIDPIYKVITGDENNATEMSQFCSYFDSVATEIGVSVIYCHHHSKGAAGKYSNAADRSSGSGVFARDPDAILDLRELNVEGLEEKYKSDHPKACDILTGWELNGTLREFAPMASRRIWFDYPAHVPDDGNYLGVATFNDSGTKGVGDDQTGKQDWYAKVDELLSAKIGDTCATLEEIGITSSNAGVKFGPKTPYEVATLGDVKVVHRRSEDKIVYIGQKYGREKSGKTYRWKRITT